MLTVNDVARYFLALSNDEESGELMSNLKLQKLVYYAQGFHLALYDKPLFNEPIEAWTHGPVTPDLYRLYKEYGSGAIPQPKEIDFDQYGEQLENLLNEVFSVYGQFSAWKLRELTHEEPPWKNAYNKKEKIISHDELKEYFKTLVN